MGGSSLENCSLLWFDPCVSLFRNWEFSWIYSHLFSFWSEQLVTNRTNTVVWHGHQQKSPNYKLISKHKEIKIFYNLFSRKWEEIHLTNYPVRYWITALEVVSLKQRLFSPHPRFVQIHMWEPTPFCAPEHTKYTIILNAMSLCLTIKTWV